MLTVLQFELVTEYTQALFYGIYLVTLIQCFRWLIFSDEGWKLREKINSVMVLTTIFIFLMSTINLAICLAFLIEEYFKTDESWTSRYKYATGIIMTASENLAIISIDGVLIYRCWIVYEKSWRAVCVPAIFWLASLACTALYSYYSGFNYKGQNPNLVSEFAQIATNANVGIYASNIGITIYSTTAIIRRILPTRKTGGSIPRQLEYVMVILAESGILYTSMIIFRLVTTLVVGHSDDASWVERLIADIADVFSFATGDITFNLILIRVYQSRVESRDSFSVSGNAHEKRNLSQIEFNGRKIPSLSEGPSSNALDEDEVVQEIQEHRRSRGAGTDEN